VVVLVLANQIKLPAAQRGQRLLGIRLDDFDHQGGMLVCEALERRCYKCERRGLECPYP
jgi:hypothetical protein